MKILKLMLVLAMLWYVNVPIQGQINIGGTPYSFSDLSLPRTVSTEVLPSSKVAIEEALRAGAPNRYGVRQEVQFTLDNSGQWQTLANGDRLWRLTIHSPDALSINLTYDHFWLPDGARLYLYNEDQSQVIGGFTSANNKGSRRDEPSGFATTLILDETITLEYYEPRQVSAPGIISIDGVIHGFKQLAGLPYADRGKEGGTDGGTDGGGGSGEGDSGPCQVNVNCSPEGNNWQDEKKGIAMMFTNSGSMCTGSLVNNTDGACVPNFLTACHCLDDCKVDAGDVLNQWMFMWNFESADCNGTLVPDAPPTTVGATVRSQSGVSDFALLLLTEDPIDDGIDVYLNGWTTLAPGMGGVGIHHPAGDIKKIATHNMVPIDGPCSPDSDHFWEVSWIATPNGHGVMEPNSSGSPLFNNDAKIVGQLLGPETCPLFTCDDPTMQRVNYGKFSSSWDFSNSIEFQLKFWLAFSTPDVVELDGSYPPCNLSCEPFLDLDNTDPGPLSGNEVFEAEDWIVGRNTILPGADVIYRAGNYVHLRPDFWAQDGSRFHAYIGPCQNLLPPDSEEALQLQETIHTAETPSQVVSQVNLFPNPNRGTFELQIAPERRIETLEIFNAQGQQVLLQRPYDQASHIVLNNQPPGMYLLQVKLDNQTIEHIKFIIQ